MPRLHATAGLSLAIALAATTATPAHAALPGATARPMIGAGISHPVAPLALDPNLPTSPFSGVVALDITWSGHGSGQCSGTLISARHVLTAAHCVDPLDTGTPLALSASDTVDVVFNAGPTPLRVAATGLALHPDFRGFNLCPDGSVGCFNDDLAIVTLGADAPAAARVYRVWEGSFADVQRLTIVGYGATGDGRQGYQLDGTLVDKRAGQNVAEFYELDDEQDFAAGAREVWYADFDGINALGMPVDTFCDMGLSCGPTLAEGVEAVVGPGDSGGAAFILLDSGEYMLAGTTGFAGSLFAQREGAFGNFMGGAVAGAYAGFIRSATGGAATLAVPEPGTWALAGLGLALLAAARRRIRPD